MFADAATLEIYSQSATILYYIFGTSLVIAAFGMAANHLNEYIKKRRQQTAFVRQSVVYTNQQQYKVKGYNGGAYHINLMNDNEILKDAGYAELREHLIRFSFRSKEGRLRELERWWKGKFVGANLKEALKIIINRIDRDIEATNDELGKSKMHNRHDFVAIITKLNEAIAFGELDSMEKISSEGKEFCSKLAQDSSQEEVFLYNTIAKKYLIFCDFVQAIKYFEKAGEKLREGSSVLDENFAQILNDLGYAYFLSGDFENAIKCHENSLLVYTRLFGSDRLETGVTYNAIGIAYLAHGQQEKALRNHFHALPILVHNLESRHPSIAATLCNIALAYDHLGMYEKSTDNYRKALEIDFEHFGKSHKSVAIDHNLLGLSLYQIGQNEEAIANFKKSLEISERVYGNDHPTTATTCNNLGGVYYTMKNYDDAIKYYERALGINMKVFERNNEHVEVSLCNLASAWKKKGGHNKAIEYYKNALEIELLRYGENDARVATTYDNLGGALRGKGDFKTAIEYKKKALDIDHKLFGEDHKSVAICHNGLAKTYAAMEDYETAILHYEKALEINRKLFGPDDPSVAKGLIGLGRSRFEQKQYEDAISNYHKALTIQKKLVGGEEEVGLIFHDIGSALSAAGKISDAMDYEERALNIFLNLGKKDDQIITEINMRIAALKAQEELTK